ncbi:MAG: ABC transporter substrate-binding protein [Myxococcota bacterium]
MHRIRTYTSARPTVQAGRWIRLATGWIAALALGLGLAAPVSARAATPAGAVVVLVSHDAAPHTEALEGLRARLRGANRQVGGVWDLAGDDSNAEAILAEVRSLRPAVVVTIGSLATRVAVAAKLGVPVVGGLVPRTQSLKGSDELTGVTLEIPVEVQLDWLRRMVPDARRVGVVYNARENAALVRRLQGAAGSRGLSIEAQAVSEPKEIPRALTAASEDAHVLLGLADSVVLTSQTARQLLLSSFRNRVPLVGPSESWVKAGALYALHWDYRDLGAQVGDMVLAVLGGTPPSQLEPVAPRTIRWSVNARTAEHMRITLPRALLDGATSIY